MLTDLEDRLSVIPRWVLVRTIQKQSVAEHSFRVAIIADRLAQRAFGITDLSKLYMIYRCAREHDLVEALSGDIASPVKPYFNERELENDNKNLFAGGVPSEYAADIKQIVKLADLIEMSQFLYMEKCLGNLYINNVFDEVNAKMHAYAASAGVKIDDDCLPRLRIKSQYTTYGAKA